MSRHRLSLVLLACVAGCAGDDEPVEIEIVAQTDERAPVADLPISIDGTPVGRTDAEGRLRARAFGEEGKKIAVAVEVPKGFQLASRSAVLVLHRLADVVGGTSKLLPVKHAVTLIPTVRRYAVLVRTGIAGLPVETFGRQRAVTNSRGAALFVYDGAPGDELEVKIATGGRSDLHPQNPSTSFRLAGHSDAYVVARAFTIVKPPRRPVHHVRTGPRPL